MTRAAVNAPLMPITLGPLEQNKALCRAFLTAIGALRIDDAMALLADDVVWWVQGNSPVAGYHHGKPAVRTLCDALKDAVVDRLDIELGQLTAEADRVALEMHSSARLRNGRRYDNTYHYLFTVRDGRIAICKEYLDTQHIVEVLLT